MIATTTCMQNANAASIQEEVTLPSNQCKILEGSPRLILCMTGDIDGRLLSRKRIYQLKKAARKMNRVLYRVQEEKKLINDDPEYDEDDDSYTF